MKETTSAWLLTGLSEGLEGKIFSLERDEVRLGRTPDNEIAIPAKNISRHHTSFFLRDGALWVKDLGSKNGTFLNEERISESLLHPDDIVRVAEFRFQVKKSGGEPPPPPTAPPPTRKRSGRRGILYGTLLLVGGAIVGSNYIDRLPLGKKSTGGSPPSAPTAPAPAESAPLEATDDEVLEWQVKADTAVGFNDMAAAVSFLRKIIRARPENTRARTLLFRCEKRLQTLISTYMENGAREFEKLYYDRAIREWRKVLALADSFDPDSLRKAQERIREAEAELAKGARP